MSKISLTPNASGTGNFTIASPNSNTDRTLTLPDSTGTVVVTSGAQTIEFADGSASAPSITNSGDTNTGMFFPAADTIAFAEGGTESMRIDSSGKVGIGTTSPAETLSLMTASGTTSIRLSTNNNQNNNLSFSNDATDFIIGTNHGTTGAKIKMNLTCPDNSLIITSGGEVYIAGTTDRGAFNLQCNGTGVWGAGAYTNGSDERIKDNITPLDTGLDVVAKLNPVTYKYKEDWSKDQSIQTGFIAQDLLVALEGKNYVDGIVQQGGEYMSVAYQNIIPILTKAIQEQQTIIETLKADIAELKAKVNV